MGKLIRWSLLGIAAYGLWRLSQSPEVRGADLAGTLDRARERLDGAIAEGQRVAAATRAQLEAQAGRALRDGDALDDGDDDGEPPIPSPWPYAPAGSGHPV